MQGDGPSNSGGLGQEKYESIPALRAQCSESDEIFIYSSVGRPLWKARDKGEQDYGMSRWEGGRRRNSILIAIVKSSQGRF